MNSECSPTISRASLARTSLCANSNVGDVLLRERHRRLAEVPHAGLRCGRLSFEGADRLLGGGNEIVEGFSRLLDAPFRHLPHFGGDLEFRHVFLGHRRLLSDFLPASERVTRPPASERPLFA